MKKGILYTFILMLYAMGSIGGFGYACYSGAYLIAFAVLVLAVMAFPTTKRVFQEWTK
jgi:uncharacterized membrane protein